MADKKTIHTIATAHLDTSWLWGLEQTIDEYIPDTIKRNSEFIEKYPEYKFNFEGSYRYELIKEYYPEEYEKIRQYIKDGKWHPCGACYENGDVNIPSPEALIRNILYGNGFFRDEFDTESNDIFLPDCFGFGRALPSVAAHCGLTGFSTGKLFWGSSVPIPFDTGRWTGPDGKGIWAALMPFSYTTSFKKMSKSERILNKLADNEKKNLPLFTLAYHGIGDRGGAPHKSSVKNVIAAQRSNSNSDIDVFSSTTKEYFDMLEGRSDEKKAEMPVFDGEFLLTAHGAGSYTSRTATKRWNRRCELLADAAEKFASAAFVKGLADYPQYGLDTAWKKVIAHHFHDDITGTSFEECYKRNHNDYIQALNTFSAEYTAACKALAESIDTSFAKGIPVIVSNPLQSAASRKGAVTVTIRSNAENFAVLDRNGNILPSQTKKVSEAEREITFIAEAASVSLTAFDLIEADAECTAETGLSVSEHSIENKYIKVTIDENGDISGIFDKSLGRELLKKPVRLSVLDNTHSFDWPAWEIKYEDLEKAPYMYADKPAIKIRDKGCALCSVEITKSAGKSHFTQIISLDCESRYVSVYNETDWREEASLLKAEFCLNAENDNANYDIGMGWTSRPTNTKSLYEVPAQKWADITDESSDFGISVFSDSRTGWDKPDKSTLRLTLVHTPFANYRWECSQHIMDMGLNRYSFAIMGHKGAPDEITAYADDFCQPMHTFVTEKHNGAEKQLSFIKVNNDNIRITALKKAQASDKLILRVTECSGRASKGIAVSFAENISEIFEVSGDERVINKINLTDGTLTFDIGHNEIKSFAISFEKADGKADTQKIVSLPCNATGITSDGEYHKSDLRDGISLPREILPQKLLFAGVNFEFTDEEKNCIACDGRKITINGDYNYVYLIAASLSGDKTAEFICGENAHSAVIPDCFMALGHWDLMRSGETGYIKPYTQALTLTHTHGKKGNLTAKQLYAFSIKIPLYGADEITLPDDKDIIILAATAVKDNTQFTKGDAHSDTLAKREFDYEFSPLAVKLMNPNKLEHFLDKFLDRTFTISVKAGEFYNKYALNELYHILRNLCNKARYKKNVDALLEGRKK